MNETEREELAEEVDPVGIRCDFCGQTAPSVSRIALDRDYERLRTPHKVQYGCSECSEKKERRRLGLERG
jgi:hypothetical protein